MGNEANSNPLEQMLAGVSPVLLSFTQANITEELWHRPGLAQRDRALVTVATLVARNATMAYPYYFNKALDSGLTAAEFSELITHLAFYASWPYAFGAVAALKVIFDARGVSSDQLPELSPELLTVEEALPNDETRVAMIAANIAPASSALQHFTDDLLYRNVWLRPGLAPRDRGLASIAILAASGQASSLPSYLKRAILKGVTKVEIGELLGHTAFYAGWGNAIEAARVVTQFFDAPQG
ncbi:carboxymuconolactone decarboxylase family protein [Rhizobium sp. ZPR3]|uniref:Carboxymuconolactone decarboxylase family protein n=2 Tax=unclassified Rhizobium TaxID=2613769 RepID=A0AAU7SI25_9HYPH